MEEELEVEERMARDGGGGVSIFESGIFGAELCVEFRHPIRILTRNSHN